jgi:hypothetical protein
MEVNFQNICGSNEMEFCVFISLVKTDRNVKEVGKAFNVAIR